MNNDNNHSLVKSIIEDAFNTWKKSIFPDLRPETTFIFEGDWWYITNISNNNEVNKQFLRDANNPEKTIYNSFIIILIEL